MASNARDPSKATARAAKAAEVRAAQEQADKRRRRLRIGGVAAIFVLIVGGAIAVTVLSKEDVDAPEAGQGEYGLTIGDPDAEHDVVIYEDFLCPICGQLEAASNEGLEQAAEDGKVLVEYRPIAILTRFGDYSVRSANAFKAVLETAGPEEAKAFHDLLFEDQPAEGDPDTHFTDDELVDLAVEAGASEDEVRDDIEGLAHEEWVADATQAAIDANVEGTPTVVLDGEPFADGSSWEEIGENLVEAVE